MQKHETFQEFIFSLCHYWTKQGCVWSQPYDQPMGAGTFHPHTFFKALGNNPWSSVYVQPCRRPVDGRYGKSPNRLQHYYQLQVFLKPAPENILDIYLNSLQHVGINLKQNDIALYEDNWKSPTLGAWGLGWEVRANGEEVTQFTYFQEFGGLPISIVPSEITYGLERLYMYRYGYNNVMDIPFNEHYTYGEIFTQNENEFSHFNFDEADTKLLFSQFDLFSQKVNELCGKNLTLPAYDYVLQASHAFNLLDARGALSVTERQRFLGRVRDCAKICALTYNKMLEESSSQKTFKYKKRVQPKSSLEFYKIQPAPKTAALSKPKQDESVKVLLELGVEELPPSFQKSAQKTLTAKIEEACKKFADKYSYNESFVNQINAMQTEVCTSSRRLAIICSSTPKYTPEQQIEIWGPAAHVAKDANGELTKAGIGFCKKQNLSVKEVIFKENPKSNVSFLYAQKNIPASDFPSLLIDEIKLSIYQLDAGLKMRWMPLETQIHPFVRPVRWLLCLVDDKIFPLEMFGLKSSSRTYGQRILAPKSLSIPHASEYKTKLKSAHVYANPKDREKLILIQIQKILDALGKDKFLVQDDELLEKCVGFSENPYAFLGKFNAKYLKLPHKLISSVLKEHMNYFSLWDAEKNQLFPQYIGIANYKCSQMKSMVAGTEKVVTSRLDDGAFYFESDLQTPIQNLREQLKTQVFQEKLGSLYDKSERLSHFAKSLSKLINLKSLNVFAEEDYEVLFEAGRHCKNDLKTGCVQEFPDELQGVMGGVLVRRQNTFKYVFKSDAVAQAIEEHYLPESAHSPLPQSKYAITLALADKLDSLILFLSAGYEPKGSHDPFGLRRLAIAIARLLNVKQEQETTLCKTSLNELVHTWEEFCGKNFAINKQGLSKFFTERIKSILKEDFPTNNVESISQNFMQFPVSIGIPLLKELEIFLSSPHCLTSYKRARTMTQNIGSGQIQSQYFVTDIEKTLYSVICSIEHISRKYFENNEFKLYFEALTQITEPLDTFFDSVLVNDENLEIRQNRLQLLLKIRTIYEKFIAFSVLL